MGRSFTDQEREDIRRRLSDICRRCWTQIGYKKTSVDELCRQAGISKGAFYLFYPSKESLFCEVLCAAQGEICGEASALMAAEPGKAGVLRALKRVYRFYDENAFLYGSDPADYAVLMSKVSDAQAQKMAQAGERGRNLFLPHSGLRCTVGTDTAVSVIYALIMNVKNKDVLPNHIEVFDYMAEHLVDSMYEEIQR